MSHRRRPTPERLRALVADDLSVAQIAERLGVSTTTVRIWLRDEGLTVTRRPWKPVYAWGTGAGRAIRGGTRRR